MFELPTLQDRDLFDESGYLRLNPGLVEAIETRIVASAWEHFHKHGRREGRRPNDVDPEFYIQSYPRAALDLGRPLVTADAAAHYVLFGRGRGYLPNARAPRPADPAGFTSLFGGLWTDRPDAMDQIQNRAALGRITDRQAARLRSWARDGYVELELRGVSNRIAPAALDLDRVFAGACPDALFECPALGSETMRFAPELTPNPAAALDIHYWSRAVRALILAPPLTAFLAQLFDSPSLITSSEGFLRSIIRPVRPESVFAGHSQQRQFAMVWIGLDQDAADQDGLHVYPGSHRLPEFHYGRHYKSIEEAERMAQGGLAEESQRHRDVLLASVRDRGMERRTLTPAFGCAVVWHPDLLHESVPVAELSIRRGILARLCPRHVTPLFAERVVTRLYPQDGHEFTSGVYPGLEPLD